MGELLNDLQLLLEDVLHAALNSVEVLGGGDVVLTASLSTGKGKILGHDAIDIDGVNAGLLKALGKGNDLGGVVELATLDETTGPGEDGGNGVGGGLVTLLVLTVVAGDGAMGSLRLEGLAIGGDEDGGHETQRAEALGDNVGLDITVVVCGERVLVDEWKRRQATKSQVTKSGKDVGGELTLESHDVSTGALHHLGDHVVDETVLVPDLLGLEAGLVLGVIELLEDVLEAAIVLLEDGVLGAHVQGKTLVQSELEGSVGEASDGLVGVVLSLGNTTAVLELEDIDHLGLATLRGVDHGELAVAGEDGILGAVLVTKGVAADDDGLLPAGNETGNAGDDDGLTEDGTAEGVSDGAVGGQPH